MIRLKLTMVGAFAVGKTSLVQRYVSGIFSERYLTTVGVKIDQKDLLVDGRQVAVLLWDLQGEDATATVRDAHLRGSAGYLLVVDGTRGHTLEVARRLHRQARSVLGPVPCRLLVNKSDLQADWEVTEADLASLAEDGIAWSRTSAKDGVGVEAAFQGLVEATLRA